MDGFASSGGHPSDSDKSPELALGMPMGMALLSVDQSISVSLPPAQASLASSSSSTPVPSSSGRAKSLKRFECDYPDCDKTFSTSGHLARHVRVHTGEKAFQCTFPECQSRFSRHDNMLQHYRNHIVRNARRRKKAFASAIASGNIGLTSKGEPYDDPNPPSHSTSSRIPLSASTSTSTSSSSTAARPSGPIFVHSPYSSLSQSQLGGSSRTTGGAAARSGQSLGSSTSGGNAGGTIASRRGPVVSPLLGPNHASSHTRPTHLNLDSLDPRDDPFARQQQQLQQQHYHQYPHPHPASASSAPSSFLSPPLASPSVMDRPHTATTSFFPAFITGATGADPQNSVTIHPPPLMHRHSYSALTNHPVLEPITPTSELPSYPSYYTHPHHQGHPHYSEHAHLHGYHQQQHPYPTSPGPYSPTLSASPSLVDGTLTPLHEPATYFQPMAQNTLYPDRYSTAGGGTSMQTHHLIPHHHHPAHHAASYPPNQPHSGTSAIASPYLLQPHSATTAGSNAAARSAISHSSLGSHNPLLSGLGVGEDTLTTGTRSSSLSTGSGGMSTHLAQPSESGTSILGDTTSYSSTSATPASSTSGPTPVSAPSSTASSLSNAPVTARWLQSPSAGISGNVGDYSITQSHPGWQPDIRGSGNVTPSLNIAGETASLSVVDPSEERPFASARAGLDDHQQFLQESVTWGPYGREM